MMSRPTRQMHEPTQTQAAFRSQSPGPAHLTRRASPGEITPIFEAFGASLHHPLDPELLRHTLSRHADEGT